MTRRIAVLAIALGGVLYAAWFLQWVVPTNLNAASSYISELSASDQPHHWLFRTTDFVAGISLIVGSAAAPDPSTDRRLFTRRAADIHTEDTPHP